MGKKGKKTAKLLQGVQSRSGGAGRKTGKPISRIARDLGVNESVLHRWMQQAREAELVRLIREIALRHHHRYDSPRVREELRRVYGKPVSLEKVAALMRENGLNARRRGKLIPTTNSNHALEV